MTLLSLRIDDWTSVRGLADARRGELVFGGESAQRCGRAAGFASLRRSPRSGDSPALLDPRSHRKTRFAHFVRCAQTVAMSQMTKRAQARADHGPALLGAAAGAAPAAHPNLCVNGTGLLGTC